jgi:hypothetical protein
MVSAFAKALDVKSFALLISYFGIVRNPAMVMGLAVLIIFAEFLLGIALIASKRFRIHSLRIALAMLVIFTGIIIYAWTFKGLEDCGCFGSFIKLSPIASLIKNIVLIGLTLAGMRQAKQDASKSPAESDFQIGKGVFQKAFIAFCPILLIGSFSWNFVKPSANKPTPELATQTAPHPTDQPFAQFKIKEKTDSLLDLGKGRYFVAFLSDSCSHCQETVSKLNKLPQEIDSIPPVVGLILGEEETLRQFRQQFSPKFPTAIIPPLTFFEFIGDAPPRFYLIKDGRPIRHWDEDLPKNNVLAEVIGKN